MARLAVIGAGAWGINHVRVIAAEPRCELVAVADPDPRALDHARTAAPRAALLADSERVLADASIDAVVIASPAATHARLAVAALEHGKAVLIEKPLAMSSTDAQRVATAAGRSGRVAMVGHLMVHHPAVLRLRELFSSGQLGALHYLHCTRVNLGRLRRDENALWSFGPHDLSMIDLLLGCAPLTVAARGQCVLQRDIEDVVFLTMRYPSGELAHVHLSWLSPRKERRLTLVCSQRMVEFDDVAPDKLRIYNKGYESPPSFSEYGQYLVLRDGDVHIPQIAMDEPLRVQLHHFLDSMKTGVAMRGDLASALRITRTLEAAQLSLARDGEPVGVDQSL
ncbi:MAG: Gfo/Idh/MocA family oxidoreductase [Deltaproteobacteria bacterium]|nr:Gfo/Idh/MocA family oxidoreductase [Deltaproteobacteria bacterium]